MSEKDKERTLVWEMNRSELLEHIAERFNRWDDVYTNGSSDPTWADGTNLNRVRTHIKIAYGYLDKLDNQREQLDLFSNPDTERRPVPPQVDNNYMANLESYIANARETAEAVEQDENYKWLVAIGEKLTDKEKVKINYHANVKGKQFVEECIEQGSFPSLRHWGNDRNTEYYGGCIPYQLNSLKELRESWSSRYADLFAEAEQRTPNLFQMSNNPKSCIKDALSKSDLFT